MSGACSMVVFSVRHLLDLDGDCVCVVWAATKVSSEVTNTGTG
jgi:hypothetical protein